ncbi:MAG: SDR family NAD(P)-dependent oxidoreductase [Thaumarchaeota archaeon]|nr:MAG: SDR family NAD(P)-dependent oxidoreductase [Nitrososphaerota archaeon]
MNIMEGKICLITGSTSGIGKEIAVGLAKMKATIILVGRDKDKCEATVQEIANRAGIIVSKSGENRVSYIEADLSLQARILG